MDIREKMRIPFVTPKIKKDYICLSDINRKTLTQMGFPKSIPVAFVKKEFEYLPYTLFRTGNRAVFSQQKCTRFVFKYELYKAVIKGFYRK